jgi:hypothetical protein
MIEMRRAACGAIPPFSPALDLAANSIRLPSTPRVASNDLSYRAEKSFVYQVSLNFSEITRGRR